MDSVQGELFDNGLESAGLEAGTGEGGFSCVPEADINLIAGLYSAEGVNFSALPETAGRLFELSANAFDAIVHAGMSELPVSAEIARYGRKVLAASAAPAGTTAGVVTEAQRRAAERAACDRGDPDVRAVLDAAYKVWHEIDRLRGLLRFCPDESGVYIARCAPDHFVLPALGPHFRERFGETPWAVIDEKRRLCLSCAGGGEPELFCTGDGCLIAGNSMAGGEQRHGEWEDLWRHYHKIINNESRNNPDLQRRFMPKRYWKYLTEFGES
jgi:probable DNA metabolism protein